MEDGYMVFLFGSVLSFCEINKSLGSLSCLDFFWIQHFETKRNQADKRHENFTLTLMSFPFIYFFCLINDNS